MLVIHSELDYRLPISEGLAMFNVLQTRGVPSKLVMFPDENHVSEPSPENETTELTSIAVGVEARELPGLASGGVELD